MTPAAWMSVGGMLGAFVRLLADRNIDHFGRDWKETLVQTIVGASTGLLSYVPADALAGVSGVGSLAEALKTVLTDRFASALLGGAIAYAGLDLTWLLRQRLGMK